MKEILSTENTVIFVYEDGEKPPSLDELKVKVGGWIEIVTLRFPVPVTEEMGFVAAHEVKWFKEQMIVNEEGHVHGKLGLNVAATRLYWSGTIPGNKDTIVGCAVHLKGSAMLA